MLEVRDLQKSYGDNAVLKGVSLTVRSGEVVVLLGPNGAGKSTLIGCLSGATRPDTGSVIVDGKDHGGFSPREAHDAGISVIHQHLSLVSSLDAVENIFLGDEAKRLGIVDRQGQRRTAKSLLARLGVDLPLDVPVGRLSTGQRQMVEIVKALHRSPRILILDEPTAALGNSEADALMRLVEHLASTGLAILYVTHLLEEVQTIGHRVVVLRDGGVVLDRSVHLTQTTDMVSAISPGAVAVIPDRASASLGEIVVSCAGLRGPGFGPIELTVRQGECVGIFGLLGSGRTELLETLAGARRADEGSIAIEGRAFSRPTPVAARRRGVHLVPSDRVNQALFSSMRCDENVLAPSLVNLRRLVRRQSLETKTYSAVARDLSVSPSKPNLAAEEMSGGNQQKLMVGRWSHQYVRPRVLILDEPTQGVDVGARYDLYRHLRGLTARSRAALIFSSSDPDEITMLADRALVLHRGRIVEEFSGERMVHDQLLSAAHHSPKEYS